MLTPHAWDASILSKCYECMQVFCIRSIISVLQLMYIQYTNARMVGNTFKAFNPSHNTTYKDNTLGNSYLLRESVKIVYNNALN